MLRKVLYATIALGFMTAIGAAAKLPLGGATQIETLADQTDDVLALNMGPPRMRHDLMDVSATFQPTNGGAPRTVLISLLDGENVDVVLPGYPQQRFTFKRQRNVIIAESDML